MSLPAPAGGWCCQLQDSEIARVVQAGAQLHIHLAAACLRPVASPVGPATAYGHGLVLTLTDAQVEGDITTALGRVLAWQWQASGAETRSTPGALPLPWAWPRPLRLHLRLQAGTLELQAQSAHLDWTGPPRVTESYAC